jgi:threonine synthase
MTAEVKGFLTPFFEVVWTKNMSKKNTEMDDGVVSGHSVALLDGASAPQPDVLLRQYRKVLSIARDKEALIEERLEAFEDLIDSEVGDTSLVRARNLEREVGLRQVFLKFEGGNPSGTQKDRIAFAQAMDALRRGFDKVILATCGNYGVAMAMACSMAGLDCIIYIPEAYKSKRIDELQQFPVKIVRSPGDYENAVRLSSRRAEKDEMYDANPGGANVALQLQAYGRIAEEIYDELRDAPAAVAVPVSNGTTLAGIYRGFLSLYRRGKTSRMPKIVAGSSFRKNPVIQAFEKNLESCEDLDPARIHESAVNEPLINWHSIDGDLALDAIRKTAGWADDASDRRMTAYSRLLREREGMSVLPASTAGLISLVRRHEKQPLSPDRYVVVITGRRA